MKKLTVLFFTLLFTCVIYGQEEDEEVAVLEADTIEAVVPNQAGNDSIRCVQNLSLLASYAKKGDYKNAVSFWNAVYDECPEFQTSIYRYASNILGWQIENEQNPIQREKLFEHLMGIHDNRIKSLNKGVKQGKSYILGRKAIDYVRFISPKKDPYKEKAYGWLSEAIESDKSANEAAVFRTHFTLSTNLYKARPDAFVWNYIDDYLTVVPMLSERAASGEPKDTVYAAMKTMVNMMFLGAVDCNALDNICVKEINEKQKDIDFLNKILTLYRNLDCNSNVYFKAAEYAYKIKPSVEPASALAIQAYNNKDYKKSIAYFKEAVQLEENDIEKSKITMRIAAIYSKLGDYTNAREVSRMALKYNPSNSAAYKMIAYLYVQYASTIDKNPNIQKTAYWAAVDLLEKAKEVDPASTASADKLINDYKTHFPEKSSIPNIIGNTYVVPGWIQEKTTVRWLN